MIAQLINRYPQLSPIRSSIEQAGKLLYETYINGGKILICGNGGSCADSEHITGELMKGFLRKRTLSSDEITRFIGLCPDPRGFADKLQGAIPAISLPSQTALITAYMNDAEPEMVFAQLAYGYATEKDLLIALSTSGNSENIVNAVIAAKARGARTLALTGANPCRLTDLCDIALQVPEQETYKIQELHLPIYHYLCAYAENKAFQEEQP